jgi:inorganic phosphate transporter, PiT family
VQAGVVLAAVAFGFFTSMNQALVGAMAGAGLARGRETVHLSTLFSILQGWVLGPAASIAAGYVLGLLVR